MTTATQQGGGSGSSGLYDVLELVTDRGLVIDAFARISLVGIEILKIDTRVVIASVDTYLRFADQCNRLDLEAGPHRPAGLTEPTGQLTDSGTRDQAQTAMPGAAQTPSGAADIVSGAVEQTRDEHREPQGERVPHRKEQ
ncbi:gas vesicle protein GvpJ [Streptomyces collinus]|uniref:gas vesicle protein GvpJ n=1 Tax=Streptomyces collinus TaxID=42684 RepID=UPI0029427636|nr:gas vesicle protein GvpJ [Streptomyces collinus]